MKKIRERIVFTGQWLGIKEKIFEKENGELVQWECLYRPFVQQVAVIIARLRPSGRFLVLQQWRQSMEAWVLGFPAGIITADLSGSQVPTAVLEELREETGYIGNVISVSPPCPVNAGFSEDVFRIYRVDIDENDPQNRTPQLQLEPAEIIRVYALLAREIPSFIEQKIKNENCFVGAGLWYVFGLQSELWMCHEEFNRNTNA